MYININTYIYLIIIIHININSDCTLFVSAVDTLITKHNKLNTKQVSNGVKQKRKHKQKVVQTTFINTHVW